MTEVVSTKKTNEALNVLGNYVSEDYAKRNEGYDWVSVSVSPAENGQLKISVRSRADQKEPTCTYDVVAQEVNDTTYQAKVKEKTVLFKFTKGKISITTQKKENEALLNFYCAGGASIGGTYFKIDESLDQTQIDKTKFSKVLNLQNVGFNISSIEKDGKNSLTIFTFGLQEREYHETLTIEGEEVLSATVADLNLDGSPELFVYTIPMDRSEVKLYAFSVNNQKSMSNVYFQPTKENSKINQGYQGQNEFSVDENRLIQRFPIFEEGEATQEPTGKKRKVSYKLVDGEAGRILKVDEITEY